MGHLECKISLLKVAKTGPTSSETVPINLTFVPKKLLAKPKKNRKFWPQQVSSTSLTRKNGTCWREKGRTLPEFPVRKQGRFLFYVDMEYSFKFNYSLEIWRIVFFFFWFCQLEMLETFPPIDMGFCFLINYVRTEMIQSMTFFESEQKFCQIECTFDGYDDMICTPLSNSQNSTRNSMVGLSCSIILTGKCFLF